jgi:hypothetical protein
LTRETGVLQSTPSSQINHKTQGISPIVEGIEGEESLIILLRTFLILSKGLPSGKISKKVRLTTSQRIKKGYRS